MGFQARPSRSKTLARVYSCAHLFGVPHLENAHVVEFGCGDGHFLIHQAFCFPGMTFMGVDNDPEAVKRAVESIARLGLRNIEISCSDIQAIHAVKKADIIFVHGLLSWVEQNVQANIIEKLSDFSHDKTLVVVSCNILPGFQVRSILHQYIERTVKDKSEQSYRDAIESLKHSAPYEFEKPYGLLLHKEIAKLQEGSDQYFLEEFIKTPHAFFLSDLTNIFAKKDFVFLGDARYQRNYSWRESNWSSVDVPKREEFFDFSYGTTFRENIFGFKKSYELNKKNIKDFMFSSSLETVSLTEDFDLSSLQEMLRDVWPKKVSFTEMLELGFTEQEIWEHFISEKIDGVILEEKGTLSENPHIPECFKTQRSLEWANIRYEPVILSAFDDAVAGLCNGKNSVSAIVNDLLSIMANEAPSKDEMECAVEDSLITLKKALLLA